MSLDEFEKVFNASFQQIHDKTKVKTFFILLGLYRRLFYNFLHDKRSDSSHGK